MIMTSSTTGASPQTGALGRKASAPTAFTAARTIATLRAPRPNLQERPGGKEEEGSPGELDPAPGAEPIRSGSVRAPVGAQVRAAPLGSPMPRSVLVMSVLPALERAG